MGYVQRVTIPYAPRAEFAGYHARTQRWACIVAHRRAGKTVATINDLIRDALLCPRERPRYAYLAPYLKQAKSVVWDYVKHYASAIPGTTFNESELRADFVTGGQVRLFGADNADALRGLYLDGAILDEAADMSPRVWSEIIRPALADRQGRATFIGTPRGHGALYELWQQAQASPDWFALMLKASETGIIPAAELAAIRQDMTDEQYAQEFECSFEAAILGAYYGKEMATAESEERLTVVPYEPSKPVDTWWDLGVSDSTSIWFVQRVGPQVRVIDYLEATGEGLPFYAKQLQAKPYVYGRHIAPHDITVRELGSGVARIDTAAQLGIRFEIAPRLSVQDGIDAVRSLLSRCWFDRLKTKNGVEALKQYRKDWDDRLKTFRSQPLHDWASHAADAFRTGAVATQEDSSDWGKTLKPDIGWIV